jgi:hypothetical protein
MESPWQRLLPQVIRELSDAGKFEGVGKSPCQLLHFVEFFVPAKLTVKVEISPLTQFET